MTTTPAPIATPSFWAQIVRDTSRRTGARLGLLWVLFLCVAAVLAPLVANTWPYLVKMDGHWSSPLLVHLTPTDITLFALVIAVLVAACFRTVPLVRRAIWVTSIAFVACLLAIFFVHPPQTSNWQQYRDLDRASKIQIKVIAVVPFSPNDSELDVPDAPLQPPSIHHWMGTESNGRDVFSRMLHATRIALAIGTVSTGIAVFIGIVIGAVMGYFGGMVDLLGMRLIEIFEGIPTLFLLITIVAFFGHSLNKIMLVIGLTTWTSEARYLRAEFLRLREQDFVHAAVAAGLPVRSILFKHLLPNGLSPILVTASFGVASAILYESVLSFLGIGLIDEPSWGQLLNQSKGVGGTFIWWIAIYPGFAIFLTVFAYNLLGEALQNALDPKLRQ